MSQINDCKFTALRGQGFTGSLNDMMLQWLYANGAYSRYFRLNEGGTDGYETNARLIPDPTAHFDIEMLLIGEVDQSGTLFAQNLNATLGQREFQILSNTALYVIIGGLQTTLGVAFSAGLWRFTFDGTNIVVRKNNGVVADLEPTVGASTEPTATSTFGMRHNGTAGSYGFHYNGVIAGVVIRNSSGQVTNGYDIKSNSNTIPDNTGSADASVINGNANDWGVFSEQDTLWKGQNLAVPPWDLVDQELVKA